MVEEQEGWPESLKNPLIRLGIQVIRGTLPPQDAFAAARAHDDLCALTDERLEAVIEEVDRYWHAWAGNPNGNPKNLLVYTSLMIACAEVRLEAISRLREAAAEDDRGTLSHRLAHWLTVMARCLLAQGQSMLLVSEPSRAGRSFSQAHYRASQQPDGGNLRLYELLSACRGMSIAAGMIGRTDIALEAERELARIARTPGREIEALDHLVAVDREFIALLASAFHRQVPPSSLPATDAPSSPELAPLMRYNERLRHYAEQVISGTLSGEAAAQSLRRDAAGIGVDSMAVYLASDDVLSVLARSAPDRATVFAELNDAVARDLTDPRAELTRGYCAFALGLSLECRATLWRHEHPDQLGPTSPYVNDIRRAASYLEEALHLFSGPDVAGVGLTPNAANVAEASVWLLRCHGQLGNTARALEVGREAADLYLALEESPTKQIGLAMAFGNMAEVLEAAGALDDSFAHHYRAFEHFLQAQSTRGLLDALFNLSRLGARLGRLDDALAAADRAQGLLASVADISRLLQIYLNLAQYLSRLSDFEGMLKTLSRAEGLPRALRGDEPQALHLLFHWELYRAHAWTTMVQYLLASPAPSGAGPNIESQAWKDVTRYRDDAFRFLEEARQLALDLVDDDLLAQVYLQRADLFLQLRELDAAAEDCRNIDFMRCSEKYRVQRDRIQGELWFRQGRHSDAADLLRRVADALEAWDERKRIALWTLGEVLEQAGDLGGAVSAYEEALEVFERSRLNLLEASRIQAMESISTIYERLVSLHANPKAAVYDAKKALIWLERGKAKTFTEALGLSPIPVVDVSESIQQNLAEEARLLAALRSCRDRLFIAPQGSEDQLSTQRDIAILSASLDHLWDELSPSLPEYVALRRSPTLTWEMIEATVQGTLNRNAE